MVIYLDTLFLLNGLADGLALCMTARLAGVMLQWRRILAAAGLGGLYGAVCSAAPDRLGGLMPQILAAAGMVRIAYGPREVRFRLVMLFFLVSCAMAGMPMAIIRLMAGEDLLKMLKTLNWKVFILAGSSCWIILGILFRGGSRHVVNGQICRAELVRKGNRVNLNVLCDTGHTLRDVLTDSPVLIAERSAITPMLEEHERQILQCLGAEGAVWCLSRLPEGEFHLLPYRCVGVEQGLLLCFSLRDCKVNGTFIRRLTVAVSPTPVSENEGYSALWGGEEGACAV